MAGEFAVQQALFTALSGLGLQVVDRGRQASDGGDATTFPYVEIGFIVMNPFDTATETGFDYLARIHVRSRSGSMAQPKAIQGQIYDRLHRGALTITGFQHILIQRERSEVLDALDGAFHGVCEYRGLMTRPTPTP
jgi:hypothetical protein